MKFKLNVSIPYIIHHYTTIEVEAETEEEAKELFECGEINADEDPYTNAQQGISAPHGDSLSFTSEEVTDGPEREIDSIFRSSS